MDSDRRIDTEHLSLDAPLHHPVEVFCTGSHIAGTLHSLRPRVSDHLESDDHVIEIAEATLKTNPRTLPFVEHQSVFINKATVLFVLDLTPAEWASGGSEMLHPTEPHKVLASVGEYWISGLMKLPIGGDLLQFLARTPRNFIPVTDVDIIGYDEQKPSTVLINRDHLEAVVKQPPG